jgi:hypothetical protein
MIARGYQGDLPKEDQIDNNPYYWIISLSIPLIALVVALVISSK